MLTPLLLQRLPLSRLLVLACIVSGACFDRYQVPDCQYAIIPALIGAGGALLSAAASGLFKSHAQKTANDANLQATRETNDLNRELWEKQTQNEWDMWNAQNEYNTPKAQAQRFREAGINPQLALAGGQLGSGSASAMTAPNAPQMQAGHVQPVDGMADFMGQIPSSFAQIANGLLQTGALDKQKAETEQINAATAGIQIENQYKEQAILSRLAKEAADTSLTKYQRRLAAQQYKWMEETRDLRYTMLENENKSQVANAAWLNQQIDSAKIHDSIARLAAWNNTRLTNAQINKLSAEAIKIGHEGQEAANRAVMSNWTVEYYCQNFNEFVGKLRAEGAISEYQAKQAYIDTDRALHEFDAWKRQHGYNNDNTDANSLWSFIMRYGGDFTSMIGNIFQGMAVLKK